jgi:hypothetical protein
MHADRMNVMNLEWFSFLPENQADPLALHPIQ